MKTTQRSHHIPILLRDEGFHFSQFKTFKMFTCQILCVILSVCMFVYPVCVVPTKATESHQALIITFTKGCDSLGGCWASNAGSTSSASTPHF